MEINEAPSMCRTCARAKNFPKYSCKTCSFRYSSNYLKDKTFDMKYMRRVRKKELIEKSDTRLQNLYERIRVKYFGKGYIPDVSFVSLQWKRGNKSGGGTCWKHQKLIKIGGRYKYVFESDKCDDIAMINLVNLMIHEMTHLRLAHHRKNFYEKVNDTKSKFKQEDLPELFKGIAEREM